MSWNIAAECISIVFLSIILVYAHKGTLLPSWKDRQRFGAVWGRPLPRWYRTSFQRLCWPVRIGLNRGCAGA